MMTTMKRIFIGALFFIVPGVCAYTVEIENRTDNFVVEIEVGRAAWSNANFVVKPGKRQKEDVGGWVISHIKARIRQVLQDGQYVPAPFEDEAVAHTWNKTGNNHHVVFENKSGQLDIETAGEFY